MYIIFVDKRFYQDVVVKAKYLLFFVMFLCFTHAHAHAHTVQHSIDYTIHIRHVHSFLTAFHHILVLNQYIQTTTKVKIKRELQLTFK